MNKIIFVVLILSLFGALCFSAMLEKPYGDVAIDVARNILSCYKMLVTIVKLVVSSMQDLFAFVQSLPILFIKFRIFFKHTLPEIYANFKFSDLIPYLSLMTPFNMLFEYVASHFRCAQPETLFFIYTWPQTPYCELYNDFYEVAPVLSQFDAVLSMLLLIITLPMLTVAYLSYTGLGLLSNLRQLASCYLTNQLGDGMDPNTYRSTFTQMNLTETAKPMNHTHPTCAADRNSATLTIERLALALGKQVYFIQRSRSDERSGRAGSRLLYWFKDVTVTPAPFELPANPVVAMVDVDMYFDMPTFLADNPHPTIIYTFQPSSVARSEHEYSYTFDANNVVTYRVSGGGLFEHMVWNYSKDNIVVYKKFLGFPYKVASFLIDRRETMPDHELVLLTPTGYWWGFRALLASVLLEGNILGRLKVHIDGFLRLAVDVAREGTIMSTGIVGQYAAANIPIQNDNTLANIAKASKYDFTMPQALSMVDGDKVAGAVLLAFHRSKNPRKVDVICPVRDAIRNYQFDPKNYVSPKRPLMVPFMSPILANCFVPDNVMSSQSVAVSERITKVKPLMLAMTPFLLRTMKEFVEFLIPVPESFDPVDDDCLWDKQNRPSQRAILEMGQFTDPQRSLNVFVKKEPYQDTKAPRLISTYNGNDKAEYGKFMYSFSDNVLKHQNWYAFGISPQQVAARVAEICQNAMSHVADTDLEKMDGHVSNVLRELELMILMRTFRVMYHQKIKELHGAQFNLPAYTTGMPREMQDGVAYNSGTARGSGSLETSPFNSVASAFIGYTEGRLRKPDGTAKTPAQAWAALGLYGGDDGFTADSDPQAYVRAAAMVGQVLKVNVVTRGTLGVQFLARTYSPYVWEGDTNTCCDLPRQLSKLHVTVQLGNKVTPVMKLLEKCRAFYLTDACTPIIGDFVSQAIYLHQSEILPNEDTAQMRAWGSLLPRDAQYMNVEADWMIEYMEKVLPGVNYQGFLEWLHKVTCLEDMLSPPQIIEAKVAKPTLPVFVDDQVLIPEVVKVEEKKNEKKEGKKPVKKLSPKMKEKAPMDAAAFKLWMEKKQAAGQWVERAPQPRKK